MQDYIIIVFHAQSPKCGIDFQVATGGSQKVRLVQLFHCKKEAMLHAYGIIGVNQLFTSITDRLLLKNTKKF